MPTILIVDDEFGLAEAVSEALGQMGYRTATAINGRLALAACRAERPDLVLLDLMMPVVTGLEMLEALKGDATLRDIPVVIMSPTEADAIPAGMRSQLRGFVQKPFTVEELMAVIEPILRPPTR